MILVMLISIGLLTLIFGGLGLHHVLISKREFYPPMPEVPKRRQAGFIIEEGAMRNQNQRPSIPRPRIQPKGQGGRKVSESEPQEE